MRSLLMEAVLHPPRTADRRCQPVVSPEHHCFGLPIQDLILAIPVQALHNVEGTAVSEAVNSRLARTSQSGKKNPMTGFRPKQAWRSFPTGNRPRGGNCHSMIGRPDLSSRTLSSCTLPSCIGPSCIGPWRRKRSSGQGRTASRRTVSHAIPSIDGPGVGYPASGRLSVGTSSDRRRPVEPIRSL